MMMLFFMMIYDVDDDADDKNDRPKARQFLLETTGLREPEIQSSLC